MTEPDGSPKLPSAKFFFFPLSVETRDMRIGGRREDWRQGWGGYMREGFWLHWPQREQRKQERKERTQKKSSKLGERGFSGRGDGDRENRKGGKGNNLDLRPGRPLHVDAKSDWNQILQKRLRLMVKWLLVVCLRRLKAKTSLLWPCVLELNSVPIH